MCDCLQSTAMEPKGCEIRIILSLFTLAGCGPVSHVRMYTAHDSRYVQTKAPKRAPATCLYERKREVQGVLEEPRFFSREALTGSKTIGVRSPLLHSRRQATAYHEDIMDRGNSQTRSKNGELPRCLVLIVPIP